MFVYSIRQWKCSEFKFCNVNSQNSKFLMNSKNVCALYPL
uniref:Uncharacterized protein n=1 Tax=Anguilla anguilla TaxID=7936 RepID=A0A0E9RPC2_ANGAN